MPVLEDDGAAFDAEIPVVIVGAGACGLVAALAARDAGAEVVVLERDAHPGGLTAMSSGMVPACGTRLQHEAGIDDDTPARLAADIQRKARGSTDPVLLDVMCGAAGPAIDWLVDRHGIRLELVGGPLYPGHSHRRTHAPPSRSGSELVTDLVRSVEAAGAEIITHARVADLVTGAGDDRRIRGVVVHRPDGRRERIGCAALVLACSGFGGNAELVRRYLPGIACGARFGHEGNRGDAVLWGAALGAALRDMGAYQGHAAIAVPHGVLVPWALIGGGFLVNADGRRFADESRGSSDLAPEVLAQRGGVAWVIYDEDLHGSATAFAGYRDLASLGAVKAGNSVRDLAGKCGLPGGTLSRTLTEIAAFVSGRSRDPSGRDFTSVRALNPPYRAVKVTGGLLHTQGGLAVDDRARVRRTDGTVFDNLFAGGGAAAGVSGPAHWGYLSGNGLLSAVALGRIAGTSAAALCAPGTPLGSLTRG